MVLLIVSVSIGLLLFGIGFLVNERNAINVISDFKSMSKVEKEQFRLSSYVKFFKYFHFSIGISITIFSLIFYLFNYIDYIGFALIFFSLPGYTFFIFRSQYYFPPRRRGIYNISAMVMLVISIGVVILITVTQFNPNIEIFDNQLQISGVYGENIDLDNIKEVKLLQTLPPIKIKVNGITMTNIKKGWFKLEDGRKVKLFVNDPIGPYVSIKTVENKTIIIGIKEFNDSLLYQQLKLLKK